MDIRKYYKDFDPEVVFENKDEIKVLRTVFYMDNNILVFIDTLEKDAQKELNMKIADTTTSQFRITDTYTEENVRNMIINKPNILLVEQKEDFVLTPENFGIGVEIDEE